MNHRQRIAAKLDRFMRQYGRKRGAGASGDSNDRHYDRKLEREIKRMDPRDLDDLLNQSDEDL